MPNNKYIINESQLVDIADAIRTKLNEQDTYTVDEMPEKISDISGSAGGSAPFSYVTIHVINASTDHDLYASYRESGYYLGGYLHSNLDSELDYYLPSVGYYNYEFPDGTILAEKDGGTATIYTLNKLIHFFNGEQFVDINGVFSCINGLSALTFTDMVNMSIVRQAVYSGDTYDIYGLTDSTQNGEITVTISDGGR